MHQILEMRERDRERERESDVEEGMTSNQQISEI
jgi:hypothetical protein